MYKFTHVDAFYQVVRFVKKVNADEECPEQYKIRKSVKFRGTVKLHGTNSGVTHDGLDNSLSAQSRSRVITPQSDNAGFAAFIAANEKDIRHIFDDLRFKHSIPASNKLTLFGEWIGPGIQKGVAINKLPTKQWVLFAAKVTEGEDSSYMDIVPSLGDSYKDIGIFSIKDSQTWELEVDFNDQISKEKAIVYFDELTKLVEEECPWAKKFGISGLGEGIVWKPIEEHWGNSDLFFKTKGQKHKVTEKKSKKESLDPEVLKSIEEFVNFSVTENRLNQGLDYLKEMQLPIERRSTGHYLKWVANDIQRECSLELEDNDLEWKSVAKAVNERAKNFFTEIVTRI